MILSNINIETIIIHQIYRRDEEGKVVEPTQSHTPTRFDKNAMSNFKVRVIEALGEDSKAVDMDIANEKSDGIPKIVEELSKMNEEDFITSSFDLASKISFAQKTKSIPGGILVIFRGTFKNPKKKFIGMIKAEMHTAYQKATDPITNEISLQFVKDVLLSPTSKLYKTAGFFQKNENADSINDRWLARVSDNQISSNAAAATYFYSDFLGLKYKSTSDRTTESFYKVTKKYIKSMDISEEDKLDLNYGLNTYLKVIKNQTISAESFAEDYLGNEFIDDYCNFIEENGVPRHSFTKDTRLLKKELKNRKIIFKNKINITGPSEYMKSLVKIEQIDGEKDSSGNTKKWTKVIIKDVIKSSE